MSELDFNVLIDDTLESLEMSLDQVQEDIDYETTGGVLTVEFENGTTMVFSRQLATGQLWLAARSGGYHFTWDAESGDWRDTRGGGMFRPFVVEAMREQAGIKFNWE